MARHEVAQEIKDIKERVRELAEQPLYTEATEIVGIEAAKEEVITRLTDGDGGQQKKIVSIAGFGGRRLGKTTLAKAVYDDIKNDFGCTAFILVSRNPDAKKLLKDMLYAPDKEKFKDAIHSTMLDETHLIDLVREFLRKQEEIIGLALIENNMRSRIITTTRIIGVAEHVGGCYRLKPLSDESSEILFYGRIFGSKDNCPRQFFEVSKNILKKCGGIPLAIITRSSLLANKSEDIRVWNDVCGSIGSGLGRNPGMDDMKKILLLSYYDLPSHLKTCLLYLSIFSEDHEIEKNWLIWRWVAEGFVQEDQQSGRDQSFLEIGESYFNELLNRSLIQLAVTDRDGAPYACRVHDTVLDLIISLSVEEGFVTTILGDGMESKVRRLSLHNNCATTWPTMKMPKIRSLTIFTDNDAVTDLIPSFSCYLLLRVLDLRGCLLNDLASLGFVGSLSHLRYLGLLSSSARTNQLPTEIGKLRFLQTLDLYESRIRELSSSAITGLEQLMCLRGSGGTRLPDGLKKLTFLEVLQPIDVTSKCIAEELGHLTQLRVLDVALSTKTYDEWTACSEALVESLGKLAKVESLRIHSHYYAGNLDGSMVEPLGNLCRLLVNYVEVLPTWIRPAWLPALSYLDISVGHERRDDIQVLGTLPCLRHLRFRVEQGAVERCAVGPDAFPCAVSCIFYIEGGVGVVPYMFPRGAMPRLQDFTFYIGCRQLQRVVVEDLGLGHLPSLRSVTIEGLKYFKGDEARKDKIKGGLREKVLHEAAVHPNHPLRTGTRVKAHNSFA
ncbi:hypothetical protein C2845_PM06G34860 [Panicum miliaceum]|uniref:Uncharacterized protein n=1 Tax=Panicum miliaceum TaxID=4540 RepID=A0A3L6RCU9_PANMI|nr:hypothetical protein C2845_PM06G34860 [Panicum miliaceum]